MGNHDLRLSRVDSAGLDAAYAARLSEHVFETWNRGGARGRRDSNSSGAANAFANEVHRRKRFGFCGPGVSICLHHDRVWRGLGISLADFIRHDTKNARA